jgi:hypothetical protein
LVTVIDADVIVVVVVPEPPDRDIDRFGRD